MLGTSQLDKRVIAPRRIRSRLGALWRDSKSAWADEKSVSKELEQLRKIGRDRFLPAVGMTGFGSDG